VVEPVGGEADGAADRRVERVPDEIAQLDDQARGFLADPTKNRFDPATSTLHLSSIFKWFRADFEAAAGTLPAYVGRYLGDPRATADGVRIEFLDYDWSLNDQPSAAR